MASSNVDDCHTLKELQDWRAAKEIIIASNIPKLYSSFAEGVVQKHFKENQARIAEKTTDEVGSPEKSLPAVMATTEFKRVKAQEWALFVCMCISLGSLVAVAASIRSRPQTDLSERLLGVVAPLQAV